MLTIVDEFIRKCLAIEVARRLKSYDVLYYLAKLFTERGSPDQVRSDNGREFSAKAVRDQLAKIGVQTLDLEPGNPWENGYNESFNASVRMECLGQHWFMDLDDAVKKIEDWHRE